MATLHDLCILSIPTILREKSVTLVSLKTTIEAVHLPYGQIGHQVYEFIDNVESAG
jgi:hypothetical protein